MANNAPLDYSQGGGLGNILEQYITGVHQRIALQNAQSQMQLRESEIREQQSRADLLDMEVKKNHIESQTWQPEADAKVSEAQLKQAQATAALSLVGDKAAGDRAKFISDQATDRKKLLIAQGGALHAIDQITDPTEKQKAYETWKNTQQPETLAAMGLGDKYDQGQFTIAMQNLAYDYATENWMRRDDNRHDNRIEEIKARGEQMMATLSQRYKFQTQRDHDHASAAVQRYLLAAGGDPVVAGQLARRDLDTTAFYRTKFNLKPTTTAEDATVMSSLKTLPIGPMEGKTVGDYLDKKGMTDLAMQVTDQAKAVQAQYQRQGKVISLTDAARQIVTNYANNGVFKFDHTWYGSNNISIDQVQKLKLDQASASAIGYNADNDAERPQQIKSDFSLLHTPPAPAPKSKPAVTKASAPQMTAQDKEALQWANANPKDPRAAKIKAKLGVQ